MAKQNDTGVYQKDNGFWEYRFAIMVDGKQIARKKCTDEFGQKLKTKNDAVKARAAAIVQLRQSRSTGPTITRRTFKEVYEEFCATGRKDRAYRTIQKQDSLWKNHLNKQFGQRFVDEVSSAEFMDYLSTLYYVDGFSYQYTEAFLKMFYLLLGQAYSRDHLDVTTYNKLCTNKDTRIRMPKIKSEDDTDIVAFSREELKLLDEYFKGKNAETAYLLGRYCGLRINECFGLKWDHVDLKAGTILIDRQMQYQNGLIKLTSPKTLNSKRTIYMSETLKAHLQQRFQEYQKNKVQLAKLQDQKQRFIDDLDGKKISSTELVNCLPDGTIQTVNSMKYPTREIKSKLGINFKYHYLRHTYGTLMAEMNTPAHLLCNQMGHGNIHVTQRYYIAISASGISVLQSNLSKL